MHLLFVTSLMRGVGPYKILLTFACTRMANSGKYAIPEEMCNYKFCLRNLNGEWLANVQPFDPGFFCIKAHPNAVLLYTPFRLQLTLLQHAC